MVSPNQAAQDSANGHVKVEYNWQVREKHHASQSLIALLQGYLDQYYPAQLQSAMLPLQNQQAVSAQAQSVTRDCINI